jgi:CHAT domain-containing protein
VVHFACHGICDARDPSRGALLLKHPEKEKNHYLKIRELAAIIHSKAQIAYLLACSTAENASNALMDEVIHIASAFQLIGFPHVIGTLWEVNDRTATEVARLFYKILLYNMNEEDWDGDLSVVAEALDEAVENVRDSEGLEANFLAWAPFIHLGA